MKRSTLFLAAALGATAVSVAFDLVTLAALKDSTGHNRRLVAEVQRVRKELAEARDQLLVELPDHPPADLFARHVLPAPIEDPAIGVSRG